MRTVVTFVVRNCHAFWRRIFSKVVTASQLAEAIRVFRAVRAGAEDGTNAGCAVIACWIAKASMWDGHALFAQVVVDVTVSELDPIRMGVEVLNSVEGASNCG